MKIAIKRVYDEPDSNDGQRVLVDRLWPRGLSKDKAKIDVWLRDIAPSTELRQWFGHDPAKWGEFQKRFTAELQTNAAAVDQLRALTNKPLTIVYGAKDELHNNAVVIRDFLAK